MPRLGTSLEFGQIYFERGGWGSELIALFIEAEYIGERKKMTEEKG